MFLHQSANLQWNLHCACDPWHIHQDWKIECWEEEYVYTHGRVAPLWFQNFDLPHCHQVAQEAFREEAAPVLVEVHPSLWASRVSGDSLLCHFGNEGRRQFDYHEPLTGVCREQPSTLYAQETRLLVSSLLSLPHNVSSIDIAFPVLRCMYTLLWPIRPYSRQGACQTVLVVPNLLV